MSGPYKSGGWNRQKKIYDTSMGALIFGAVLFNAAVVMGALGVIGDLLHGQRIMTQRTFERVRRIELQLGIPPSHYEPGARDTGHPATTGAHAAPTPEEQRQSTQEHQAVNA